MTLDELESPHLGHGVGRRTVVWRDAPTNLKATSVSKDTMRPEGGTRSEISLDFVQNPKISGIRWDMGYECGFYPNTGCRP